MNTAEQNYLLLQEIEASRMFLLMAYRQNPALLEHADARIRQMLEEPLLHKQPLAQGGKQRGISLIELILFIVIISIAVAGILLVMNQVTGYSADALVRKQSLAIAESLLEEVELMPFTFCDPNDVNAAGAANPAVCAAGMVQDVLPGPVPNTETRYAAADPFDNVADYGGFTMPAPLGIFSMTDGVTPVAGLGNYSATVAIAREGVAMLGPTVDDGAALRITVTVTGPDGIPLVLEGYRTRYAPGDVP